MDGLTKEEIKHIAVPNPKIAPYGEVAVEVLKYYNIYDKVEKKLVYGESVSQTNQFILSGAAELGFTSKSTVLSDEINGKGNWIELARASYSPIAQGAVILNSTNELKTTAQAFLDFLSSSEGQAILEEFGYVTSLDE
jgi:molybdate transport system substrate-binding protein